MWTYLHYLHLHVSPASLYHSSGVPTPSFSPAHDCETSNVLPGRYYHAITPKSMQLLSWGFQESKEALQKYALSFCRCLVSISTCLPYFWARKTQYYVLRIYFSAPCFIIVIKLIHQNAKQTSLSIPEQSKLRSGIPGIHTCDHCAVVCEPQATQTLLV